MSGPKPMTDAERWVRFDSHVRWQPGGCWLWIAGKTSGGYGHFMWPRDGRNGARAAHRLNYERVRGMIPAGQVLDHFVCENRACVNPDHVRPVSRRESVLRGDTLASALAARTSCPHGHPYAGRNLYIDAAGGRRCRICLASHKRARMAAGGKGAA